MIYEIFLLIVPIAVTPYVARVLGENGSGQYSYTFSINTYFVLFASLGFSYYAQRLIASHQGDTRKQTVDFWEIIIARLFSCVFVLIIYFLLLYINVYDVKYSKLMLLQSFTIVAVLFDINFYFQGNEEFGKIVFRNVVIKSISIACIFIFVKNPNDLPNYTLIQSLTILFSNLSMWLYMPRYLVKIEKHDIQFIRHIFPTIVLFIPTIATSIYTSLDKTLIGIITKSDAENGNYEYAEKLIKMTLTVLTSLGNVMSPRNSKRFAEGDIKSIEENIFSTTRFVFFLGVPLMLGIISVADNLIPWYLGSEYDKAANLMKLLSPLIIIIGMSNVFGRQFLIPSNEDKKFTISIVIGAVTNFILNIIFIRIYKSYGAAIATVVAETVITAIMYYCIRKHINLKNVIKAVWKYIVSGLLMFVICNYLSHILSPSIIHSIAIIVTGIALYTFGIIIMKDDFIYKIIRRRHK